MMQLAERSVARRAYDERRLRALEMYLERGGSRETYASIAAELGVTERTVSSWFTSDDLLELVDELVPLWPAIGRARMVAAQHAERMLQFIVDLADGHVERARAADRLKAAQFVLAIAGVRATEQEERKLEEPTSNANLVSVQVGGMASADAVGCDRWAELGGGVSISREHLPAITACW